MESMNESGFNYKPLIQEESIQELLDRLSLEKGPCQDKDHHLIRFFPPVLIPPPEAKNDDSQLTNANTPPPNPFSGEKFIETCDCQNCTNRRDVTALVNEFDNKKAQMIKELNGMKSETDQLDEGFMQLNSRINALTVASIDVEKKLVAGYQDDKKSDSVSAHDMGDGDFYPKPRGPTTQTFQNDVRTLKKYQNVLNKRLCEKQKESELDINNPKPEMNAFPHQLEIQLQRAHESNHYMLDKMKHLENIVKVLVGNTDVYGKNEKDLAEVTALMEDDPEAALQKLRLMKDAFESNHNLIMSQREKLHCQSMLVSKYDRFVTDMQNCMNVYFQSPIAFQENADLLQRFGQLYACVKQVITDNGLLSQKLEALHNIQESISRENSLLNETVSSLNDHIEELSHENDKLMLKFRFNNKSCPPGCECMEPLLQSNNSTPRTPDLEIKQVDDITFKFNFLSPPPSSSYFPQAHSTSAICPPPTPASIDCGSEADIFNNNFATNYVNNLKRVAQCLEDLKRTSSYILSPDTSLNPHPPNSCSTPAMTSLASSPLSSSRR